MFSNKPNKAKSMAKFNSVTTMLLLAHTLHFLVPTTDFRPTRVLQEFGPDGDLQNEPGFDGFENVRKLFTTSNSHMHVGGAGLEGHRRYSRDRGEEEEEKEGEKLAAPEEAIEAEVEPLLEVTREKGGPALTAGVCGAHLARDALGRRGVFKPACEEAQGASGQPLKRGVRWGDSARKERAAFLLGGTLANVPRTELAREASTGGVISEGSFQSYVEHDCSSEDVSCSRFSAADVQRIGALDVRLLNLDRHEGNILVVPRDSGCPSLVPIDHGYCLPSFEDTSDVHFAWTHWPQAKAAWEPEVLEAVRAMEPLEDARAMRALALPDESVAASVLATRLLQHCAAKGLSLHAIARLVEPDVALAEEGGEAPPTPFQQTIKELEPALREALAAGAPWAERAPAKAGEAWAGVEGRFLELLDAKL